MFNVGSPYNVPAGSQVNLDKVIEKYRREAFEDNERKLQQQIEGKIPPDPPYVEPSNRVRLPRPMRV